MVVKNVHVFSLAKMGVCEQEREELVLALQQPRRDACLACQHFYKVLLHLEVGVRVRVGKGVNEGWDWVKEDEEVGGKQKHLNQVNTMCLYIYIYRKSQELSKLCPHQQYAFLLAGDCKKLFTLHYVLQS